MQKTHSRSRTILLSVLMVLMCVSLIVGATFALFVDKEEYAIGVNTGNIDVQGTLTMTGAWSQGQSVNNREAGTQITDGYSLPQGGSVTLTDGKNIKFTNMSLGDGAAFNLKVTNSSSVDMKYSVRVEVDDEASPANSEALAKSLTLSVLENGETGRSVTFENAPVSVIDWTTVTAPAEAGEIADINFEITLPWDKINNFDEVADSQSISMTIVLEAVQANAFTGTIGSGDQSYDSISEAITNVADGATISLGGGITAEWPSASEMENVDKAFNVYGAGKGQTTIEPASEEDSVVLPAGSSISNATIAGNVVAGENTVLDNVTVTGAVVASDNAVISNATVNGTISYTPAADTGTQSFSTLAKVSRVYTPATTLPTVTLTNATVLVEGTGLTRAINIVGANLVMTNSTVTLSNTAYVQSSAAVYVEGGAANISNSTIVNKYPGTGTSDTAFGLWLEYTNYSDWGNRPVSVVSDSRIEVVATGETDYLAENEQALRVRGAAVEVYDSTITGGTAVTLFRNASATISGGTVVGDMYAVSGSNTMGSFTLNVTDGAVLRTTGERSTLYVTPQSTVTIGGGALIEGYTAIEAKMGDITINDATIRSTAAENAFTVTPDGGNAKPDGAAIKLETRQYAFNSFPEGYNDPNAGNNALTLTISNQAVIEAGAPCAITYYSRGVEQDVTIVNNSGLTVYGVATDAIDFAKLYADTNVDVVILARDITVGKLPNLGNSDDTYFANEGREGADASELNPVAKSVSIDLNGKKLTVNSNDTSYVLHTYSLTIANGKLDINYTVVNREDVTISALSVQAGSKITLNDVDYTTTISGILALGKDATIEVINDSTIATDGYSISTNAATENNYGPVINVKDSTVTANTGSGRVETAILFNVPGTLYMESATVNSGYQSIIARGGDVTLVNCTLNNTITGDYDPSTCLEEDWKSGNSVPLAALVVGNRGSGAYQYATNVTLTDVEINATKGYPVVYVYGNASSDIGATLNLDTASDLGDQITVGGGYVTVNLGEGSYTLPAFSAAAGSLTINGVQGTVIAPATHASTDFGGIVVRDADGLALTVRNVAVEGEGTDKTNGARGIVVNEGFNKNVTLTAEGCKFDALSTGIYLGGVTNATVTGSSFTNCTAGMGGTEGMTDTFTAESCTFADNGETIGWAGSGTLIIKDAVGCDSFMDYTKNPEEKVTVTDGNYNSEEAAA